MFFVLLIADSFSSPQIHVCSTIDTDRVLNPTAYMNFQEATDALFSRISHADLAKELGVSVATIRQARLRPGASAHRTPSQDWERAVMRLAEERVGHFRRLLADIREAERENRSDG